MLAIIELFVWPGVVVVLGIAGMCILRKPLIGLINRTQSIDKIGLKAAPAQLPPSPSTSVEAALQDAKSLMEKNYTEAIRAQEEQITIGLQKIRFENPSERESLLIRALARSELTHMFDQLSMSIFGSQLGLLVEANSNVKGIPETRLKEVFELAKNREPGFHRLTTLESYSGFLTNANLLRLANGRAFITGFGKEFMKHLVDIGATYPRLG